MKDLLTKNISGFTLTTSVGVDLDGLLNRNKLEATWRDTRRTTGNYITSDLTQSECIHLAGWLLAEVMIDPTEDVAMVMAADGEDELTREDLMWADIRALMECAFPALTLPPGDLQ